jgi:hypothetical protein
MLALVYLHFQPSQSTPTGSERFPTNLIRFRTTSASNRTGFGPVCGHFPSSKSTRTDSAPLSPETHPVLHRFSLKPLQFRTGSELHILACPVSQPNCSKSAPLFSQTHPVSHRFSLKPHRFCTGPPPLPVLKTNVHRFRTAFPRNPSGSAPVQSQTTPIPHRSGSTSNTLPPSNRKPLTPCTRTPSAPTVTAPTPTAPTITEPAGVSFLARVLSCEA